MIHAMRMGVTAIKVAGVCDESHTVAARDLYVDALRLTTQSPIPS